MLEVEISNTSLIPASHPTSTSESILEANQRTLETLHDFLESNADAVRFREKLEESYYFREFDTEKDFNLDFIFRQLPTIFNVSDSERIGMVSTDLI